MPVGKQEDLGGFIIAIQVHLHDNFNAINIYCLINYEINQYEFIDGDH